MKLFTKTTTAEEVTESLLGKVTLEYLTRAVSALSLSSLSFDMALKDIIGEDRKGRSTKVGQKREEDEIEALISSVSRYITDVVVGDNLTEAE